jgi:hypothetical protein
MGLAKSLGLTDIVHLLETYRPRRAQ